MKKAERGLGTRLDLDFIKVISIQCHTALNCKLLMELSFCWPLHSGIVITTPSSVSTIDSVTTCNCLGQIVTLQCTAIGGAFTVWAGSAFMCQGGEISLTHVRFLDSIGACNDGAIIAQGVSLHDNHYTSHLNVTLSSELVGRTVSCSLDDGTQLTSIGSIILALNTISESVYIFIIMLSSYNFY